MKQPHRTGFPAGLLPHIFFHPDYTVGYGISPYRALLRFADFTAGEELHLALKYFIRFLKIYNHYILFYKFVNSFVEFVEHGGVALFNCMNNAMVKMVF